jgi:serine/threonine protein kinase
MNCQITESELWSGLDRESPDIAEHIAGCDSCKTKAKDIYSGITAVAAISTPSLPAAFPVSIGTYLVHRRLGEGGMGIVYEAQQQATKRMVAIKVVRGGSQADDYRLRLFQREAQTLGRLKHPSIASVYEGGRTAEGEHFFAMELVNGTPLTQFVRENGTSRSARLRLFQQICDAIHYAHQRGVIHRDLKPSNILVDGEGRAKVLDFGLARITDPDGAMTTATYEVGRVMGTLPYMSPEEVRGDASAIDVRSDLYSLGVILFELLTDELPYTVRRSALPEAIRTICEVEPRRGSSVDRTLRGDLDGILARALEKDPSRRYQSAAAMADDVERYLTHQPVLARRRNAVYVLRKLLARHRLAAISGGGLLAVFFVTAFAVNRITQEQRLGVAGTIMSQDFRVATIENRLADTLFAQERYTESEPVYRSAMQTFLNVDREERAAPVIMQLVKIIMDLRPDASTTDWEEAETLLLQALDIYERQGMAGIEDRKKALQRLIELYSPERLNYPDELLEIENELRRLDNLKAASAFRRGSSRLHT